MIPEITALYAGLLALWQIFLGYRISVMRRKHKVGIGSGGNLELNIAVTATPWNTSPSPCC